MTPWQPRSSALPKKVDLAIVNGRVVVEDGQVLTVDLGPIIERHNQLSREMIGRYV